VRGSRPEKLVALEVHALLVEKDELLGAGCRGSQQLPRFELWGLRTHLCGDAADLQENLDDEVAPGLCWQDRRSSRGKHPALEAHGCRV
jgi:hypothetical protein